MQSNWATEHLQVIRTLMERASVYRRALAPVMLMTGLLGIAAAIVGWSLSLESNRAFGCYWGAVSLVGLIGAFLLVRRQALKDKEPFWSSPTRRITQALLPPLFAGWISIVVLVLPGWLDPLVVWWLPAIWMILYGCAIHAAGFFMPRGMKLFGWLFVAIGCALLLGLAQADGVPPLRFCHWIMGLFFGGLHLAYGIYLFLTEKSKNAS